MIKIINFTLCCIFCFVTLITAENAYQEIEERDVLPILTPFLEKQEVSRIRLNNGLKAYIISNPNAEKSGAALIVEAGSMNDPKEYPGLAHFLEHMLFLGTEKYPKESEFREFVKQNGGIENAYTAADSTMYLFSVNNNAFVEGIDRLAQFFISPLLQMSQINREAYSIDQEFYRAFNDDRLRSFYVFFQLANPGHPYSRFSCGNKETVSMISPDILRRWYNENYSANKMHLVIYSALPKNVLKELVSSNFSSIPAGGVKPLRIDKPIIQEKYKGHKIYITPIKNIRKMIITWELPKEVAHMEETSPWSIIAFVLGHKGNKSLLSQLKREGFAQCLRAGGRRIGFNNFLFSLEVNLTEKGVQNTDIVIQRCYQAIALLKKKGIPRRIFEEIRHISTIEYQYQRYIDVFDIVKLHGRRLLYEDIETYPMKTLIPQKYEPMDIKRFLEFLIPENAFLSVIANLN